MNRLTAIRHLSIYTSVTRLLLAIVMLWVAGCKSEVPEGVMDEDTMEDVLYDYHLAQTLSENITAREISGESKAKYTKHYYIRSVLEKHGLTQKDFDTSLEYYTRHSDLLLDIYKRLNERLSADAGTSANSGSLFNNLASNDTTDIWQGSRSYLLTSTGRNYMTFEQPVDTMLKAGDKVMFHFQPSWIYREGAKKGVVQLSLVYANDTVVASKTNFSNSRVQEITMTVGRDSLIAVRGLVYQQEEWSNRPKLLVLNEVSLIRFREKEKASEENTDSTATDETQFENETTLEDVIEGDMDEPTAGKIINPTGRRPRISAERELRDSLIREDSLKRRRSHFK